MYRRMSHLHGPTVRRWRWLALLLAIALLPAAWAQASTGPGPRQLLETTLDDMIQALRENRAALQKDPDRIYPIVQRILVPKVDFPRASHWVLGRYWRKATPEQRQRFMAEFRKLLVRFYSTALVEYVTKNEVPDADIIRFLPVQAPEGEKDVTVRSEVRQPGGSSIPVQYQMYRTPEGWKVYDVSVQGISMVVSYRSTFAEQIRSGGIDGLIDYLQKRNNEIAAKTRTG